LALQDASGQRFIGRGEIFRFHKRPKNGIRVFAFGTYSAAMSILAAP
jgi:hypothetical protein